MLKGFALGCLLSFTWELSCLLFQTYIIREPTKKGLPLSASSKDPNGTLLNGLNAKRNIVKTFAFWELAVIAQKQPDRRKAIFADFERPAGPIWTSMLNAALEVISTIDKRITTANPAAPQPTAPLTAADQQKANLITLPKLLPEVDYNKPIFVSSKSVSTGREKVGNFLKNEAQRIGQSPRPWSPPIKEAEQRFLEYTKPAVQEQYTKQNAALMQSSFGRFFRSTPIRRINAMVLASPVANAAIIVDAIEGVIKMLVSSLNEDAFGKVVQGVPRTVRQFTKTIRAIEQCVSGDLDSLKDDEGLEEVTIIHQRLKAGLRELLGAFQVFLNDVGLGIKDLNEAKKAAEDRPLIAKKETDGRLEQDLQQERETRAPGLERLVEYDMDKQDVRNDWREESRRIESQSEQPRRLFKTATANGNRNVFGARDFNNVPARRREMEQVR